MNIKQRHYCSIANAIRSMTIDDSLDYKLNPCDLALLLVVLSMLISTDPSSWHNSSKQLCDVLFRRVKI